MQNHENELLVQRLLETIEQDIYPLTKQGVANGNKIFGAALLRKSNLSTFLSETNNETENPLWHGEMHALKRYYEIPAANRPPTSDLLFLSTHEPCSLCLSAITWAGFDNFYYLFSHQDSRDAFAIPHDLKILKEVFDVEPGGYRHSNEYWTCHSIPDLAANCADQSSIQTRLERISESYNEVSRQYQNGKSANDIPLD